MGRKIIILERINIPSDFNFRYCMWADVPASRRSFYANSSATSEFKGASVDEIVALKNGSVVEEVGTAMFPVGTTVAQIKTDLEKRFDDYQNRITNANHFNFYGSSFDGTTWTNGGVS